METAAEPTTETTRHDVFVLEQLESNLQSQKQLALLRIRLLEGAGDKRDDAENDVVENTLNSPTSSCTTGLPSLFVPVLQNSVEQCLCIIKDHHATTTSRQPLSDCSAVTDLKSVLQLYHRMASLDATLQEELDMEGAHRCLSQIIRLDVSTLKCCSVEEEEQQQQDDNGDDNGDDMTAVAAAEANQDTVMELQDLACEIASYSKSFPVVATPLTRGELLARLPLVFRIVPSLDTNTEDDADDNPNDTTESERSIEILIHQVTMRQSAQKDVGFVMWPSAVVLSQWLVNHPEIVKDKTVLELGAGCGLVGLVAGKQQQQHVQKHGVPAMAGMDVSSTTAPTVVLSDFNDVVVQNLTRNLALNGLANVGSSTGLDFFQQESTNEGWIAMNGQAMPQVDVVLASDVICQPEDAFAVANTIACALKVGGTAIMVSADSKHRFGVEQFEAACQQVGCLTLSIQNVNHMYRDILTSMAMTSGFVDGMALTMYTMTKAE